MKPICKHCITPIEDVNTDFIDHEFEDKLIYRVYSGVCIHCGRYYTWKKPYVWNNDIVGMREIVPED